MYRSIKKTKVKRKMCWGKNLVLFLYLLSSVCVFGELHFLIPSYARYCRSYQLMANRSFVRPPFAFLFEDKRFIMNIKAYFILNLLGLSNN